MIKDDTRQTIKFVAWVIAIIIVVYIAAVIIVFMAGSPSRKNDRQISQVASQKTPIKNIQQYYHLNRGTDSYALKGTAKKGQVYYFIYLPNSKRHIYYHLKRVLVKMKLEENLTSKMVSKRSLM